MLANSCCIGITCLLPLILWAVGFLGAPVVFLFSYLHGGILVGKVVLFVEAPLHVVEVPCNRSQAPLGTKNAIHHLRDCLVTCPTHANTSACKFNYSGTLGMFGFDPVNEPDVIFLHRFLTWNSKFFRKKQLHIRDDFWHNGQRVSYLGDVSSGHLRPWYSLEVAVLGSKASTEMIRDAFAFLPVWSFLTAAVFWCWILCFFLEDVSSLTSCIHAIGGALESFATVLLHNAAWHMAIILFECPFMDKCMYGSYRLFAWPLFFYFYVAGLMAFNLDGLRRCATKSTGNDVAHLPISQPLLASVSSTAHSRCTAGNAHVRPCCSICMHAQIDTLLVPCGHMFCQTCARRISVCALCNSHIMLRQCAFFS